ncbi:MAG: DUF2007 domain-containing protein [SAR324 cluster bacterium]
MTGKPARILLERCVDPVDGFGLQHFLKAHGIPVSLSDNPLRLALGDIPFTDAAAELYLENPAQEAEARALIERYRSGFVGAWGPAWTCRHCGEVHEPQFWACWRCGTPRRRRPSRPRAGSGCAKGKRRT